MSRPKPDEGAPVAPRRLLHIIAANRWGEPWRHALDVCRHFSLMGWSVTAYTRDAKAIDTRFRQARIDLRHCALRGFFDISSTLHLVRDLRRERPGTIVHVHRYRDAFAVLLARKIARRKDIRVVSTRHKLNPGADNWLARRIYRNLDAQVFISAAVRERFLDSWRDRPLPFPAGRLHTIPPAANLEVTDIVPEPGKGPKIVLCKSDLVPGNGLETMIDAMSTLRGLKTRLWIVGDGDPDYIDTLRRRAQVLGVMDMIDWKLRPADPSALIDDCHVAVDPSVIPCPFGPAHIEYMAHGRPQVLSSSVSPSEHVASGREAIIVPPSQGAALGNALKTLIEDPAKRRRMGEEARRTFDSHFSWQKCANRLQRLYRNL